MHGVPVFWSSYLPVFFCLRVCLCVLFLAHLSISTSTLLSPPLPSCLSWSLLPNVAYWKGPGLQHQAGLVYPSTTYWLCNLGKLHSFSELWFLHQ